MRCQYGAHVWLDRVAAAKLADPYQRNYMVVAATHELGHVLGLRHRKNTCAIMSYEREEACPKPPVRWQLRCRPLERDDVKGAILRYGGKRKQLAPAFCNAYQPAQPPVGVTSGIDQYGRLVDPLEPRRGRRARVHLRPGEHVRHRAAVQRRPRSTSRCTRPAATA